MGSTRRQRKLHDLEIVALLILGVVFIPNSSLFPAANAAFYNGMPATLVIGQSAFGPNLPNQGLPISTMGLMFPRSLAFDSSGNLWVADGDNNRVLRYPGPSFPNGMPADLVIGQSTFTTSTSATTPTGLHGSFSVVFDSFGNLWVTDRYNSRVLRYPYSSSLPHFTTGMAADLEIGQLQGTCPATGPGPCFTTSTVATMSTGLWNPWNIAFDSFGNLWVADDGNNRVLRYTPPFTNGMAADLVIGQTTFTSNAPNQGLSVSSVGLHAPDGIAFDSSGNLWVGDDSNNRVLRYPYSSSLPHFTTGMAADLEIGQLQGTCPATGPGPCFTTNTPATTSTGENIPTGIAFDSSGNLWVAEATGNNRVLRYPYSISLPHFTNGKAADLVLGQSSFTTNTAATGQSGLTQPEGVGFDSSGNLWVVDQGNNRVLSYPQGVTTTTTVTLFTTTCGCTTTRTVTHMGPSAPSWTELILPLVVIAGIAMGVSYIMFKRKLLRRSRV